MYYLGIDLGTSNIKTVLIDGCGAVIKKNIKPVGRCENSTGVVEQDVFEIYSAVRDAVKQVTSEVGNNEILSVGISSQGGAVVPLSDSITPAGKAISWLDTRGVKYNNHMTEKLGSEFFATHTGYSKAIMFPGQFLRLKTEQPEFFAKIKQWGFVGDVVVGMLTGKRAHDYTSLSISGLFNPYKKQADCVLLNELGVSKEQLPTLQNAFSVAGSINRKTATETGLMEGTSVSPAVHDQYAAAIAADVTHNGDVMLATGTAWVLLAVTNKMQGPITPKAFACPHPVAGLFGQMIPLGTGGSEIQQVMQQIGHQSFTVEQVDDLLVDSGNPVYAAVKGLAELTGKQFELMRDSGIVPERVILSGPAAESKATPQIIQDVTGLEVKCFTEPAASAYGAALIAKKINES